MNEFSVTVGMLGEDAQGDRSQVCKGSQHLVTT